MKEKNTINLSRKEELLFLAFALAGAMANEKYYPIAVWKAVSAVDELKRVLMDKDDEDE